MFCSKCGNQNDDSARFCGKCGALIAQAVDSSPSPQNSPAQPVQGGTIRGPASSSGATVVGKNPTVALVLSIFFGALGVGQFYNGDWKKGITMAGASLLLGVPTGGLVSLGVWIWSMIDSYKVATGQWKAW